MRYIESGKPFQVKGTIFGVQPKNTGTSTQLSISIDGVNYNNVGNAFTGCTIFSEFPAGLWLKCDQDIYCTENASQSTGNATTITSVNPSHGTIQFTDLSTNIVYSSGQSFPTGTRVKVQLIDYWNKDEYVFDSWSVSIKNGPTGTDIPDSKSGATLNPYIFIVEGDSMEFTANLKKLE